MEKLTKQNLIVIFLILVTLLLAGSFYFGFKQGKFESLKQIPAPDVATRNEQGATQAKPSRIIGPVSMSNVKAKGCVADGLLSEYSPQNEKFIALINRSDCYYLHRAIETWLTPPDFEGIQKVMNKITKPNVVFGMFIAEAIDTREEYKNTDTGHEFDFKKMCRNGSKNIWGEGTCKPDFASKEYRDYIHYITEKAIDMGVQSFTFGQIYMQENPTKNYAPKIVQDMRDYAKQKGVDIIIGAQTGSITDPNYLKLFDYIEGGVGLKASGDVENGPCLSTRGSCWALLWNKTFSANAKNVLLHLDWTGIPSDDLDIFARMTPEKRAQTLQNLYTKFTSQNMGFLMPYFGVLDTQNGGCSGPKKRYYSPDDAYSCKDENVINAVFAGKNPITAISQAPSANFGL